MAFLSISPKFGIRAVFAVFTSCGVPARWRDLRHVFLDICRE